MGLGCRSCFFYLFWNHIMILLAVIFLVVILLSLYQASQGVLSALLLLGSALFAGVVAAGSFETLVPIMSSWRPEYARGVMFLGCFLLTLSILRFLSDYVVPKDIKLPPLVNKISGGVVGFLATWVIVGTTVMGLEMLPLPESIGGSAVLMDDMGSGAKTQTASASFMTWIFNQACGGGLGGTAFSSKHPDFSAELVGYRHTVQPGARTTLDPELIKIREFATLTPEMVARFGITADDTDISKPLLLVRTAIDMGGDGYKSSAEPTDKGTVFMATTTQVRLVTANAKGVAKQYYPVGILVNGAKFKKLGLASGYVIDDYADNKVLHDWVFAVGEEQEPKFIEIKSGGRVDFEGKETKTLSTVLASAYPPHKWRANVFNLNVTVKINGQLIKDAQVVRLSPTSVKSTISGLIKSVNDAVYGHVETWQGDSLRRMSDGPQDLQVSWSELLPLALQAQKQEGRSLEVTWKYATTDLRKYIEQGEALKSVMVTNQEGVASGEVLVGEYTLFVVAKTDEVMQAWVPLLSVKAEDKEKNINLTIESSPMFTLKASGK